MRDYHTTCYYPEVHETHNVDITQTELRLEKMRKSKTLKHQRQNHFFSLKIGVFRSLPYNQLLLRTENTAKMER